MNIRKALLAGCIAGIMLLSVSFLLLRSHYVDGKISAASVNHSDLFSEANKRLTEESKDSLLVLFGNSRVAQWDPLPSVPGSVTVNRGIAGETTSQMIKRFSSDVLGLGPRTVVIQAGINDLVMAGLQPDIAAEIVTSVRSNIEAFVDQSVKAQIDVVILTIIPPDDPPWYRMPVWSKKIPIYVEEVNSFIRDLPQRFPVIILDAGEILNHGSPDFGNEFAVDTLHLNEKAYRKINIELNKLLLSKNVI